MTDETDYVVNYRYEQDSDRIRSEMAHRVAARENGVVITGCGCTFQATDVDFVVGGSPPDDRCGKCDWPTLEIA